MISDYLIISGLLVDFFGAVTIVGHDISLCRKLGLKIQSTLHRRNLLGRYDWANLENSLKNLPSGESIDISNGSNLDDLAKFIFRLAQASGAVPQSLINRKPETLEFEKIDVISAESAIAELIKLVYQDPTTPAIEFQPIEIRRSDLYYRVTGYIERKFLLVGVSMLGIGILLQLVGYICTL